VTSIHIRYNLLRAFYYKSLIPVSHENVKCYFENNSGGKTNSRAKLTNSEDYHEDRGHEKQGGVSNCFHNGVLLWI
jgi:hypothetical protein